MISVKKVILILTFILGFISCEKEVFNGGVNGPRIAGFGKFYVNTNPKGYKVYIDNKNWSVVTPDTVFWLDEGNHKLTLRHNVFSDSSMSVVIEKSSVRNYNVDMMSNPRFYAKVFCSTDPSATKIYLNDKLTNYTTPATIPRIYPGQYEIKFQKTNCRDDSSSYLLKGGQYYEIRRTLEDTSRAVSYRTNNSPMSSNVLNKVVVDKNNNKWIGSIDNGLIKFDGKHWTNFENSGVIDGSRINDLLVDRIGRLWVASVKGLFVYDGINWQSFTSMLPSANVVALEEDVSGNIWIANSNALIKYDNVIFKTFTSADAGVPLNNLLSLSSSKNGDIWIGSYTWGIIQYSNKKFYQYTIAKMGLDVSISNEIQDLIVDKNNNLYAYCMPDSGAHFRGALIKYNGLTWEELSLPLLFYADIYSFYNDDENNIWMTYNGGLLKYNEFRPLIFFDSDTNGFFSKLCSSFFIDHKGDGWLTTLGGGIVKLKKGFF